MWRVTCDGVIHGVVGKLKGGLDGTGWDWMVARQIWQIGFPSTVVPVIPRAKIHLRLRGNPARICKGSPMDRGLTRTWYTNTHRDLHRTSVQSELVWDPPSEIKINRKINRKKKGK